MLLQPSKARELWILRLIVCGPEALPRFESGTWVGSVEGQSL